MEKLPAGIYEQVIDLGLRRQLEAIAATATVKERGLATEATNTCTAPHRLGYYHVQSIAPAGAICPRNRPVRDDT